jgi:hypothetical protein
MPMKLKDTRDDRRNKPKSDDYNNRAIGNKMGKVGYSTNEHKHDFVELKQ